MPDAESFVAAIASAPADDLPRLVYADWLDENGDPARAAFIRDHVALAKLRPGTDEYRTLFRRCADTLRANLPAWIKPACDAFGQPAEWKPGKAIGGRFAIQLAEVTRIRNVEITRGFVGQASIWLDAECPPRALDELLKQYPVTNLTLRVRLASERWDGFTTDRLRSVRALTLFPVMPMNMEFGYVTPAFTGLSSMTLNTASQIMQLCQSPLAKQLVELRVANHSGVLAPLVEFPLDDRLQTFALLPAQHAATDPHAWSAISRVAFRPTLKRLDLTRCGMTDDGLAAFARGEEWVRLQGLKLGGNLFGDRGWADFCRGWRTPELTYLDASRNRLTDAGAEMLSRSGMMRTVRVIDLRGNRIAGRGAVALARAVAEGKVNKLLLAGNPLGKREAATVKGLLGERVDLG